jgi:hypothetical protein
LADPCQTRQAPPISASAATTNNLIERKAAIRNAIRSNAGGDGNADYIAKLDGAPGKPWAQPR